MAVEDLLTSADLVCSPLLAPERLCLAGVRLGVASHHIPRESIINVTFSPIVHNYRSSPETGSQFFDNAGKQLTLSEVIDSVLHADGIVHIPDGASFKIAKGEVVGLSLYGRTLGRRFGHLKSYDDFRAAFGSPDRVVEDEAYGDLLAYDHYYFAIRKHARWSPMSTTLDLVNWGAYEGNTLTHT